MIFLLLPYYSPTPLQSSPCFLCQSSPSPPTQRRFPPARVSAMTSQLTRGCLTTTTGQWQMQRLASTMVRRKTVMGVWWLGSTGSSSPMAEHRLSGNANIFYPLNIFQKILYNYRYRADHETGYTAEVTYEGEAKPYVAPPKPAYPAVLI